MTNSELTPLSSFEDSVKDFEAGRVYFVGTGNQELLHLTLLAVKTIENADEILLSRQVSASLLEQPEITIADGARIWQVDDNPQLAKVAALTAGSRTVAWLVPGDPLADLQCADWAPQLSELGCSVDMVPGLSMSCLATTSAGVKFDKPVTFYRGSLADTPRTNCIFTTSDQIVALASEASAAGWRNDTPVLAVLNYATTQQQSIATTLKKLPKAVVVEQPSPLLLVIGQAATRPPALNWYEAKPLFGWQVLIPRTKGVSGVLERRLEAHGAATIQVPTLAVEPPRNPQPMERAIQGLVDGRYQWIIFNSANSVRAVTERLDSFGLDARAFSGLRIAAVGEQTVEELQAWGIKPDLIPMGRQSNDSLAKEFPAYDELLDPIDRIFLPRADIAVDRLANALNELGWQVEDVIAYRTIRAAPPPAEVRESIKSGRFDAVVFTSSTSVRNMVGIAGKPHNATIIAAIGPATVEACQEHGLRIDVVASEPSVVRLADELADFAAARRAEQLANGQPIKRPSQRRMRRRRSA